MVDATTLGQYMSGGKTNTTKALCFGGYIADKELTGATPNNLFENILKSDLSDASDWYLCFYIKNKDAVERFDQLSYWLSTSPQFVNFDTTVKWGLESRDFANKYKWFPSYTATGASFVEVADSAALDLGTTWTIAAWFRTTTNFAGDAAIVNKGGFGSDVAGENMNYGIWMNVNEKIVAGFETGAGADNFVTSPLSYNDGKYHHAAVTYDGTNLKLFIDGSTTPVATLSTSSTPETNAKPLRIGANSRAVDTFFTGEIDEVLIYNRVWTQSELINYWNRGTVPSEGKVYQNKFGADWGQLIAQEIANIHTAPQGIEWLTAFEGQPLTPNIGQFNPQEFCPVWVWWHVNRNARDRIDDPALFSFKFFITIQGTGSTGGTGGGGTGGGSGQTPDPVPDPSGGGGGNPPATPLAVKTNFVADWGCKSMTTNVVNLIINRAPKVVLSGGDNSYDESSVSCWINRVSPIKSQLTTVVFKGGMGNHDVDRSSKKNDILSFYGESRTYYAFNIENIHYVIMDSESSFSIGSNQYNFIVDDLVAAKGNPNIHWIIVVVHRPLFSASSDHPDNEGNIAGIYMPIFYPAGVDLVLSGHNHNWQRTYPVSPNASDPDNPIVADNTAGPYTRGVGVISCIVGTGGHDSGSALYNLDNSPAFNAFQNDETNGILEIETSNNGQTLTGRFIDTDGEIVHEFVINRV